MEYTVVIEKSEKKFGAWVPDLPGCVSTGSTIEEATKNIAEAIEFHLESMLLHGEAIPQPTTSVATVKVAS